MIANEMGKWPENPATRTLNRKNHVFDASVPELGDLDGGVATSILLGERVVERAHRLFDRGSVGHGGITTGPALWSIPWLYRPTRQVGKFLNHQSLLPRATPELNAMDHLWRHTKRETVGSRATLSVETS